MRVSDGHYAYVGDDPAGVESAIADLGRVGDALGTLAGEVEHDTASIQEHWPKGHTGRVAAGDAARVGGALDECHQVFARAERGLGELYPVLVTGRRRVDELNDAYRMLTVQEVHVQDLMDATHGDGGDQARLQHGQDALRVAQARAGFGSLTDIDTAYEKVKAQVVEETGFCTKVLNRLTAEGRAPGVHVAGETRYDLSFGLLAATSKVDVADILAGRQLFPSDDPKAVHDAWILLSADQRADLLAGRPDWFGNLNGVPAKDRDNANRITLNKQLDRLQAGLRAAGMEPITDPDHLEWLTPDQTANVATLSGMTFAEAKQALIVKMQLRPGSGIQPQLLAYEPGAYGGKGRAAIAFGDVDQADNIAFCVPGLNSGLHNFKEVSGDALSLLKQAKLADLDQRTAVVAWQGYDAPGFTDVPFQDHAEAGAKLLAADVNAMRTTHGGPIGMLTVVGHSYGSTTTGLALQREHLDVDQVALIGSPGVGGDARTAADLRLDRSQVFVGSASQDIVTTLPDSLGADPSADEFGKSVTRFHAESVDRTWPISFDDHSLYYDSANHSESLYALADIVTGHGDRLEEGGMLARPRYTQTSAVVTGLAPDPVMDPEASWTPTTGHDHANDAGRPSS